MPLPPSSGAGRTLPPSSSTTPPPHLLPAPKLPSTCCRRRHLHGPIAAPVTTPPKPAPDRTPGHVIAPFPSPDLPIPLFLPQVMNMCTCVHTHVDMLGGRAEGRAWLQKAGGAPKAAATIPYMRVMAAATRETAAAMSGWRLVTVEDLWGSQQQIKKAFFVSECT